MSVSSSLPKDQHDLPISGADAAAIAGYDAYVREFVSYGSSLRDLFAVVDENPNAALLNAHASALHMAFEGAEGWEAAAPYLERAAIGAPQATERERLFCAAVAAWGERDFDSALNCLDELTVRWPADLCAIKWGQYHAFNLGDQDALLRFGERARIVHEGQPYAHGMIAFALEQNHRLAEAEDEGLHAAEIAIDDAWAHHAVAHVMETQGRAGDGIRWLDHCAHTWDKKGTFIREHNWWHAGLFRLALHDYDDALRVFDERLWGEWPEFPQEQIGATSMLWRLEMRGVDVGERWAPILEQVRVRKDEHLFPFHDLHYVYALARAGEPGEAENFLSGMAQRANDNSHWAHQTWGQLALPAAQAVTAFARGQAAQAHDTLAPLMKDLHRVGGSHAQRHVFQETLNACAADKSGLRRKL